MPRRIPIRQRQRATTPSLKRGLDYWSLVLLMHFIPFAAQGLTAQVHTDASAEFGDKKCHAGDPKRPSGWKQKHGISQWMGF